MIKNNKMYVVDFKGNLHEVETKYIYRDQYDTVEGKRLMDTDITKVINDVRLGELYTCETGEVGTYDEIQKIIDLRRSNIGKCFDCKTGKKCFWWQCNGTEVLEAKSEMQEDGSEVETTVTRFGYDCDHIKEYGGKCQFDIEGKPVLFREKHKCFFCEHPQGLPDNARLRAFMFDKAEDYKLQPYFSDSTTHYVKGQACGSHHFSVYRNDCREWFFELENSRQKIKFCYNLDKDLYVYVPPYSQTYKATRKIPIVGFDKFDRWFKKIVYDFKLIC